MAKLLMVPHIQQPKNSVWCGPACVAMVHGFHSRQFGLLEHIALDIKERHLDGTDSFQLSKWLLDAGYAVTIRSWYQGCFPRYWRRANIAEASRSVELWAVREFAVHQLADRIGVKKSISALLELGGKFIPKTITKKGIRFALDVDEPPIVRVNASTLNGKHRQRSPHYVVPVAADDVRIWYLDPAFGLVQRRDWEVFLSATATKNPSVIFISPPKKEV